APKAPPPVSGTWPMTWAPSPSAISLKPWSWPDSFLPLAASRRIAAPVFQHLAGPFELGGQRLLAGQGRAVLGRQDLVGQSLQGVFRHAAAVLGTEDEPHRGILAGAGPVLAGVVAIEVHLADVAERELIQFQILCGRVSYVALARATARSFEQDT